MYITPGLHFVHKIWVSHFYPWEFSASNYQFHRYNSLYREWDVLQIRQLQHHSYGLCVTPVQLCQNTEYRTCSASCHKGKCLYHNSSCKVKVDNVCYVVSHTLLMCGQLGFKQSTLFPAAVCQLMDSTLLRGHVSPCLLRLLCERAQNILQANKKLSSVQRIRRCLTCLLVLSFYSGGWLFYSY